MDRAAFVDTAKGDYNIDDVVKKLNQFHFYDEADEAADRASLLPPELRSVIYRGTSTSIKKAVESVPIKKLLDTYSSAPRWAKRDPKLAAAVVMRNPKLITHIDATARTHKDFIEAVNMGIFIQVDYEFDFFTLSPAFIQYKNNHGEKKARFLNDVEELAPSKLPFRDEFIEIRDEMDVQALVDLSVRYINIPEGDEISHKYGISKDVFWPNHHYCRSEHVVHAGTRLRYDFQLDLYFPNNFLFVGLSYKLQKQVALALLSIDVDFYFTFDDVPHGFDNESFFIPLETRRTTIKYNRDVLIYVLQQKKGVRYYWYLAQTACEVHPHDKDVLKIALEWSDLFI